MLDRGRREGDSWGTIARINTAFPHWFCLNYNKYAGKVGFHIRDGAHDLLLKDWNYFMDFADKVWK